nr:MAG TPA: Large polyvalent protein associated domain 29 [Bacteriophage sp.]
MKTNFFAACQTLDELKAEFRRLAMLHHPDRGGDTATMQAVNAEFDRLFPLFKLRVNASGAAPRTHETAESVRRDFYTANGWAGVNYEPGRTLKEIAATVRRYIKEKYPCYKFSVRTAYASMCQELHVDMKEAPIEIYKTVDELTDDDRAQIRRRATRGNDWQLNSWTRDEENAEIRRLWETSGGSWYRVVSDGVQAVANDVDDFVNSFNYDDCDGMINYFDVNFYYFGCLQSNGLGVAYVPREDKRKKALKGDAPETGSASPAAEPSAAWVPAAMVRVDFCPEHDGIEAYFTGKPSERVRASLKADGWRWHGQKKCWYNRNTEQHLQTLRKITESPEALTA